MLRLPSVAPLTAHTPLSNQDTSSSVVNPNTTHVHTDCSSTSATLPYKTDNGNTQSIPEGGASEFFGAVLVGDLLCEYTSRYCKTENGNTQCLIMPGESTEILGNIILGKDASKGVLYFYPEKGEDRFEIKTNSPFDRPGFEDGCTIPEKCMSLGTLHGEIDLIPGESRLQMVDSKTSEVLHQSHPIKEGSLLYMNQMGFYYTNDTHHETWFHMWGSTDASGLDNI